VHKKKYKEALNRVSGDTSHSPDYWQGFRRGLQRGFCGVSVVGDAENDAWLSAAHANDKPQLADRARGYLDGLAAAAAPLSDPSHA
jgi:hypothetical protein